MVKVISGGQTGVDQIALEVAMDLGLETGGWMPKGFLTEDGHRPEMRELYGMEESNSSDYPTRTELNVCEGDITIILNRAMGPGSRLTQRLCRKHKKPCLVNPSMNTDLSKYKVVNFAGTRGSRLSEEDIDYFHTVIRQLLNNNNPFAGMLKSN